MGIVRDKGLAPEGVKKIEWVRRHMPLLNALEARFLREKPFEGLDLTMSIHLEAKTARAASSARCPCVQRSGVFGSRRGLIWFSQSARQVTGLRQYCGITSS